MSAHEKTVLQFSGGKDSLACLFLLKSMWDEMTVLWVNAGASFPETVELMEKVKALVPHFMEVRTNQPAQVMELGYPVDVLPLRNDVQIQRAAQIKRLRLQGFFQCCWINILQPMDEATKRLGATTVIRGQKLADGHKSPVRSGDVIDGITYLFPIESWSDADVFEYLKSTEIGIPEHYRHANTSLDCWSCTAYLGDNVGKVRYMKERHPEWYANVIGRLEQIESQINGDLQFISQARNL
jgi:3'-phosphoadenosine 5'-phosphosulfate sulfotransferase (PAPS reductase)/FAD synthetase